MNLINWKKNLKVILAAGFGIILYLGITASSCSDKKNEVSAKINAPADTNDLVLQKATDKTLKDVRLEYKFKKGESFTYRLTTSTNITQEVKFETVMTRKLDSKRTFIININVKDVNNEGIAELFFTISKIKAEDRSDTGAIVINTFETGQKFDSTKKEQMIDVYLLNEGSFSCRISSSGEIKEVYNTDKIQANYFELSSIKKDTVGVQQLQQLQLELSETIIKPLIGQVLRRFPDNKIGIDSTWFVPQQPLGNKSFRIDIAQKFKVKDIGNIGDNTVVSMEASLLTKYELSEQFKTQPEMQSMLPVFTGSGKFFFDYTSGKLIKSKTQNYRSTKSLEPISKGAQMVLVTRVDDSKSVLELL